MIINRICGGGVWRYGCGRCYCILLGSKLSYKWARVSITLSVLYGIASIMSSRGYENRVIAGLSLELCKYVKQLCKAAYFEFVYINKGISGDNIIPDNVIFILHTRLLSM